MFDHFIVVQFISNKKILCIIWPSVFDHPVFYRSHISSVLTYRVVKKTITNIKYYTLVDIFSVKLWQMKLKFYTVFSLILISSGVYLFGLMENCNSSPNLLLATWISPVDLYHLLFISPVDDAEILDELVLEIEKGCTQAVIRIIT